MNEQQLDRKDLKIMVYKEKIAELEERVADLRVELTVLNSNNQQLTAENESLQARITEMTDVVSKEDPDAQEGTPIPTD